MWGGEAHGIGLLGTYYIFIIIIKLNRVYSEIFYFIFNVHVHILLDTNERRSRAVHKIRMWMPFFPKTAKIEENKKMKK